jgi:hypothetical protein
MCASMVLRTLESLVSDLREVEERFMFVLSSERKSAENPLRVREVNTVLAWVCATLRLIPGKLYQL